MQYLATTLAALAFLTANAHATPSTGALGNPEPRPHLKIETQRNVAFQLPGMSHHFSAPENPHTKWNERNLGFGFEFRDAIDDPDWAGWSRKTTLGAMQDSLGAWGLYTGMTLQKRLASSPITVDFGPGAFLFWRTFETDGPHRLMPAVLPVLSFEHRPTGIGLNMLFVPHLQLGSRGEMPAVLYGQVTVRL